MKKQIITAKFIIISFCIFVMLFFLVEVNAYLFINDSKLKITEDISASDSVLLQKEFSINLPAQAQITAFGYSTDLIVIRIEGVENLPAFLTDAIHLELDAEELEALTDHINDITNNNIQEYKDMYGTEHQTSFFLNSNYQTNPIDSSMTTSFFLLDGKLVIEIKKEHTTSENRGAIKEIVGS